MTKYIGTSAYMAPEIANNEFYDEKCDVFSFAIIMFEVLTENFNPYGEFAANIETKVAKNPLFRYVVYNLGDSFPDLFFQNLFHSIKLDYFILKR